MASRIIILLDMDYFFAQVEERESPQFKGKPVVVGAEPNGGKARGVVSTANYEARKYGIHSGLPISKAWQLCPDAIFLPPNFELYSRVSKNIMRIINDSVQQTHGLVRGSVVEQVSLDEAYIDVSNNFTIMNKMAEKDKWEEAEKIAQAMRKEILAKEKLTCSCGVGPNKMIAKIACEAAKPGTVQYLAKPRLNGGQANGVKVVTDKEAEKFVVPLNIEKMPGIGKKTAAILHSSRLETVADLKKLSKHDLENLFGKRGKEMYLRVRGQDNNLVESGKEVKSIGKEVTFEKDTRDPELLLKTFEQLIQQVILEIQEQEVLCKTITVVCRFTGFETHTKTKTLEKPTNSKAIFRSEAMKLFLRFLVENKKPLRLIGVRAKIASTTKI